ncbi:peptidoglycan endopeptidase [uncultured Sphingomonas sp.]|uniref:peptidoglycan endopeptidase n=1 Tax=unclassified Sphingomonas TaxID=196159 RepID=UPI0025E06981|nr:peptidoglycan endopeptidase [uncultured Sphingomonas sp.]
MTRGERVAAAARGLVGVPFRLHGRDPATGLDCVGVVALALRASGHKGAVPEGYPLRSGDVARFRNCFDGLVPSAGIGAGDVLLCRSGPGQVHLAIHVGNGFVHADAGLRRVAERPGVPPWPMLGAWRIAGNEQEAG